MYDATGGNVVMVGHSLGGGLATAAGTMPRYSRGNHAGIRAHYIEGDILNTCRRCRSRRPEPTARAYATAIPGGGGAPWNATRSRIPCYCERMRGPVGHTLAMIGAVGMLVGAGAGAACSETNGLKAGDYFTTAVAVQAAERIRRGDVRGLSRGIAEGLDAGTRGREGMDLLKWSWAWACEGCFELLLHNGAGTGHVPAGRYTGKVEQLFLMPIMQLAARSRDSRYLSLLLEHGGIRMRPTCAGTSRSSTGPSSTRGSDPLLEDEWGYSVVDTIKLFKDRGVERGSEMHGWYVKVVQRLGLDVDEVTLP